jgi:HAE1 family hydrophobic/amphiphilic exporter-1
VKNDHGEMVPYSAFMTMKKTQGPNEITRYNMYNSAAIRGLPAEGYTTADAIQIINEVAAKTLPHGYKVAWKGCPMMKHSVEMKRSTYSLLF